MPSVVAINVYDLARSSAIQGANSILRHVGLGAFHAAVELSAYNKEWSYGWKATGTGVFAYPPRGNPSHTYREQVHLGRTLLSRVECEDVLKTLRADWIGTDYDALTFNCVHFCDTLCVRLGVDRVPVWIGRTADWGGGLLSGISGSVHVGSGRRATVPSPPEPKPVILGFETKDGQTVRVMASKKPLGLKWIVGPLKMQVAEVFVEGHGHDIGILAGWRLKSIGSEDVSGKSSDTMRTLLSRQMRYLPASRGKDPGPSQPATR